MPNSNQNPRNYNFHLQMFSCLHWIPVVWVFTSFSGSDRSRNHSRKKPRNAWQPLFHWPINSVDFGVTCKCTFISKSSLCSPFPGGLLNLTKNSRQLFTDFDNKSIKEDMIIFIVWNRENVQPSKGEIAHRKAKEEPRRAASPVSRCWKSCRRAGRILSKWRRSVEARKCRWKCQL